MGLPHLLHARAVDLPLQITSDPAQQLYFEPFDIVTHGVDLVSAVLRSDINAFVNLGSSNGRSASPRDLCVDLSDPVSGPAWSVPYCGDLQSNTSDGQLMRYMNAGESIDKRFQVSWRDATGTYWLRFGSDGTSTDTVRLTCDSSDAGECAAWTMTPNGTAIARLTFLSSARRSLTTVVGDYRVPFSWVIDETR